MSERIHRNVLVWGLGLAAACCAIGSAVQARPGDTWQERRLLQPSAAQLRQEHRGKVFIYDGLEQGTVQKAMDTNFDRIENMMFIRIHRRPANGSEPVVVEEDGC